MLISNQVLQSSQVSQVCAKKVVALAESVAMSTGEDESDDDDSTDEEDDSNREEESDEGCEEGSYDKVIAESTNSSNPTGAPTSIVNASESSFTKEQTHFMDGNDGSTNNLKTAGPPNLMVAASTTSSSSETPNQDRYLRVPL